MKHEPKGLTETVPERVVAMSEKLLETINDGEWEKLFRCCGAVGRRYVKGETVIHMSKDFRHIGVLMTGRAHVSCVDFEGHISVVERLESGDVFGELFSLPMEEFAFFVTADSDCEVRYLDYAVVVHPCGSVCACHCKLLHNLFHMAALKSRNLSLHINVLSRRTTREKLATYFETLRMLSGTNEILLPFSFTALADYICSDRSAMTRELKKMKEEGEIRVEGHKIMLLKR